MVQPAQGPVVQTRFHSRSRLDRRHVSFRTGQRPGNEGDTSRTKWSKVESLTGAEYGTINLKID